MILGAGPGGYAAAFYAADLGMDVTVVDPEDNPGGVCLYRGCIPSKVLLHVVKLKNELAEAEKWGLSCGEVKIDVDTLRKWKQNVIGKLTGGLGQLAEKRKVSHIKGMAAFKDADTLHIEKNDGKTSELTFDNAIIATGSSSIRLPGAPDSKRIMTSSEALDLEEVPETLLVVGGGYIGLEMGQVYARLGSRVTVAEMLPNLLPGADRDLARFLDKQLKTDFDSIRLETKVSEVKEKKDGLHVTFETDGDESESAVFDKMMVSIGRKPDASGLGLENTAVQVDDNGFIKSDSQCRTDEPNVFVIGDIAGEPMLAHKASHEGRATVEAVTGKKTVFEPRSIPAVVFSDPEIAWCGLTETQAREQGRDIEIATFPWAASGRALTLGRNDGLTKLVIDPESRRVLGVGVAGVDAGELIAQGSIAIEMSAVAEDLALTIQAHPTLSETIMEAAEAVDGKSTHFIGGKARKKK